MSDHRQVTDGNSLVTQERLVRDYARKHHYQLERLFVEEGETAKTDDRRQLQQLLTFARENTGRIAVLIIPKIDRLARNIADYLNLKLQFQRLEIRVESVGEHLLDSPVGRFTETMLASVAQFDNEIRAERCKGGMMQAVMEGRWVWLAPRGYRNVRVNNKATIEPDPIRGRLIAEAFERLAAGRDGPKDVRSWLATQGVDISRSQFHRMIRSKVYIGIIESFGLQQRAAAPFVPLVSERTFHLAQEACRAQNSPPTYQRDNPEFPLRGTVRCKCGRFLTAGWAHGRHQRYAYYRCLSCRGVNLSKQTLEQAFIRMLGTKRIHERSIKLVEDRVLSNWSETVGIRRDRTKDLQIQLARAVELRKAIALKNAQGIIPDAVAKEQIEELSGTIAQHEVDLHDLSEDDVSTPRVVGFSIRFLANLARFWIDGDVLLKKRFQRFFFAEGLVLIDASKFRTEESRPLTEVRRFFCANLSRVVDHRSRSPKFKAKKPLYLTAETWLLLTAVYRQFGPESASFDELDKHQR